MYHFKDPRFFCLALALITATVHAGESPKEATVNSASGTTAVFGPPVPPAPANATKASSQPAGFKPVKYHSVSFGFFSWTENTQLTLGAQTATVHSNLLGNSLGYEYERYFRQRHGFLADASLLYGNADVGGTQGAPVYTLANQSWYGASAVLHYSFRFSQWILISVGPVAVYRLLNLPNDPSGTTATSGSTLNYGATVGLKLRLGERFDVRQEIGTLMNQGSTYWSIGLGYRL